MKANPSGILQGQRFLRLPFLELGAGLLQLVPQAFGPLFSIEKSNLQILDPLLRSIMLNEDGIKVDPDLLIGLLQPFTSFTIVRAFSKVSF